jgi:hypothetical protein
VNHPGKNHGKHYWLIPLIVILALAGGSAVQAASLALGYGGVGVYPQQASANSERYFRCIVVLGDTESLVSLRLSGVSGQTQLEPKPNGNWGDATDGVVRYIPATRTYVMTIGPYAGRDIFGNQRPNTIGTVGIGGNTALPFTFTAVTVSGTTFATHTQTSSFYTNPDNSDLLEWFSGQAAGVDPLAVLDGPSPGIDNASGSNTLRFRVQYRIVTAAPLNLLPRFGTYEYPPGPLGNFADFDDGEDNARSRMDRAYDHWTYYPSRQFANDSSTQNPRFDDFTDQTGSVINYQESEVALIINGERSRPRYMRREDPSDSEARDQNGIRYFYDLLPTDYADFIDNIFLFPFDPPFSDPRDAQGTGVVSRPFSNNYVALRAGGHTYEFIATDDFSPPDMNNAWLQVGQPGNAHYNDYMRPIAGSGGQMESTRAFTRFMDSDGSAGGYGYPFNSQDPLRYPEINPVLTAHPYFPRGSINPGAMGGALGPGAPGAAPNPFLAETGAGPNPPQRFTNDDTILPNFFNIRPDTDATAPFRGGKWTSTSTYTLRINYWQSNNLPPDYIQVRIRRAERGQAPGAWRGYTMEKQDPADNNYTDGVVYRLQVTPDQLPEGGGPGDYNYQFVASDGVRTTLFPNRPAAHTYGGTHLDPADYGVVQDRDGNNDYYWFRVNRPPAITNQSVTPAIGRAGDSYRFQVTYTDPDGEVLNANSQGDRPFETSIYVDRFGSPLGQARVGAVQSETQMTYTVPRGNGYGVNELAGYTLEVQSGAGAGRSYTIASNTATQVTLIGGSRLVSDGVTASDRVRFASWFAGTLEPVDASDTNYTNGVTYVFDTATHVVLGPGIHRYYFVFRDDWGSWIFPDDRNVRVEGERVRYPFTGEYEGPEVIANTPPVLTDFRFTPQAPSGPSGTTATPFVFSVTYKDDENNPPTIIRLGIDGTATNPDIILNMTPDDPLNPDQVFTDGAIYKSAPVKLTEGQHIFRAQASDGAARFPAIQPDGSWLFSGPPDPQNPGQNLDSVPGPLVAPNTPPILSFLPNDDGSDPNNPPGLEPNSGRRTTVFTYTVKYTDVDRFAGVAGNPPDYVRVYIDDQEYDITAPSFKVDPNDNDYTDGVVYQFTITNLSEGTPHTYFFAASDGLDRDRLPKFGVTPYRYNGPLVDEPPGEPKSLLAQDTPNDNGGSIDLTFNPSRDDGGGAADVTEYRIYRTETAGAYGDEPVAVLPATGAPAYSHRDRTAVTGVLYYYVVRAFDRAAESINSNEAGPVAALDNIQPLPPTGVTAADPAIGGTLDVSWNPSPDDGAGQNDVKEYRIYRSTTTTGFGPPPVGTVPAGTTTFRDSTAQDGTQYYYMVRAWDGANESADSNVSGGATSTDGQPPVIDNLFPADRALDVPVDTRISFSVTDTGTGVNRPSLVTSVTANGVAVTLGAPTITGTANAINVSYRPVQAFPERAVVNVTVTVEDNGGQQATQSWRFTVAGPPTYSISGAIRNALGVGLGGVTVTAGPLSAVTGADGTYTIVGLAAGTYTVVPVLRNFSFSPEQATATVPPDAGGVDFTSAPGYDIAGRVFGPGNEPLQGVTFTDGVHSVVSDDQGRWRFRDLRAGTYIVTPNLPGYVFTPSQLTVTIDENTSGVGQTVRGALQTFRLSGTLTDLRGSPVEGVEVAATANGVTRRGTSNAAGMYVIEGLLTGRWTVTPTQAGYEFRPVNRVFDVAADTPDVNFVAVPVYALNLAAGLSFVALPVDPENPDPLAAFGAGATVMRFDPSQTPPKYEVAVPGAVVVPEVLKLRPGRGFWVRVPVATTARSAGTLITNNRTMTLQLSDGWNMTGNPYDADLPWSKVGVVAGGPVRDFAYIYNVSTRSYELVSDTPGLGTRTSVPRGAGMWMRSTGQRTVNISPLTTAEEPNTRAYVRAAGDFVIPLWAETPGGMDTSAVAGVLDLARSEPEAYAIENPPALEGSVDVYFVSQTGQRLTCDIRGQSAGNLAYDFEVQTQQRNVPVTLRLPDLSQVPRDKAVTLVDLSNGKRVYARTMQAYTYNSGDGGVRSFRLELGPPATGLLTLSASAAVSTQGAVVTYTLSRAAQVDIEVVNISGRTVRLLQSGQPGTAGTSQTLWDLRNAGGSQVPSGTYLLRVRATTADGQQVSSVAPLMVRR